jgi:YD repeat-containing protein
MKELIGLLSLILLIQSATGQYYYKDIIIPRQTAEKWKVYKDNKVSEVTITSFEANGEPTEGFAGKISISGDFSQISTYTRSDENQASTLVAKYDGRGMLTSTIDTSDRFQSITEYAYNDQGHILSISNSSLETDNQVKQSEQHIWKYDDKGIPNLMLKIKEGVDTSYIRFVADEKGNITEERLLHKQDSLPAIFYYYDDQNRLTDIVRYNQKARRLLPDYIFEYDEKGHMSSMLIVPEGNDYQKWIYQYNDQNVKDKETCLGRGNVLLGRIQYDYRYKR